MPSARRGGQPRQGLTIRTSSPVPTLFDKSRCCRRQPSVGVVSSGVLRPKMNTMAHETKRGCAAMSPNAALEARRPAGISAPVCYQWNGAISAGRWLVRR